MDDQLPIKQIIPIAIIQVCESLNINILFPFVAFMVEDLSISASTET